MSAPTLSLVIPVRDEQDSLPELWREIVAVSDRLPPLEAWFVDDGSTDDSWNVLRALAAVDPRVKPLRLRRSFGKSAALAVGIARTCGEVVCTLDADLQDDPAELPRFLAALTAGADLVSGWKKERHDPWHKTLPSLVFNFVVSRVTGVKLHDHNCGFKAYRRAVTQELYLYGERHRFTPTLAAARGFRVAELVVHHRPRKFGHSKYGWRRFLRGLFDLATIAFLTKYGERPLHCFGPLALAMAAVGTCGLFGAIYRPTCPWMAAGTAAAWLMASQLLLAGLLAELLVHQDRADWTRSAIAEELT